MGDASKQASRVLQGDLLDLSKLVNPTEIIEAYSPDYLANTQPWSAAKDKKPQLVLRPSSIASLSGIVSFLANKDLDYRVRSQGYGSVSASDVLISLSAFDSFEFNREEQHVVLGAGGSWGDYYKNMHAVAPDWTIVCVRTPSIGIGGTTLSSGFSWLSSEYGCVSDPDNLLDARVVTADGTVKWASSDPDLLWSLRGTQTGFAIVTHFKFRARPFPENGHLWGGPILLPRTSIAPISKGIMSMVEKDKRGEMSQKTACFLYVMKKDKLKFIGATEDMLVVHAFDQRGEEKGREEFKWALEIEGAVDSSRGDMNLWDVGRLQGDLGALRGAASVYWSAVALTDEGDLEFREEYILKSFEWWQKAAAEPSSVGDNVWLLYELFSCKDNASGRDSSAWPRPVGYKHMLLLGTGWGIDSPPEDERLARKYIIEAHDEILGKPVEEVAVVPNGLEDFHNIDVVYQEHLERLRQVKTRVDPRNRLQGWFKPYSSGALQKGHPHDGILYG